MSSEGKDEKDETKERKEESKESKERKEAKDPAAEDEQLLMEQVVAFAADLEELRSANKEIQARLQYACREYTIEFMRRHGIPAPTLCPYSCVQRLRAKLKVTATSKCPMTDDEKKYAQAIIDEWQHYEDMCVLCNRTEMDQMGAFCEDGTLLSLHGIAWDDITRHYLWIRVTKLQPPIYKCFEFRFLRWDKCSLASRPGEKRKSPDSESSMAGGPSKRARTETKTEVKRGAQEELEAILKNAQVAGRSAVVASAVATVVEQLDAIRSECLRTDTAPVVAGIKRLLNIDQMPDEGSDPEDKHVDLFRTGIISCELGSIMQKWVRDFYACQQRGWSRLNRLITPIQFLTQNNPLETKIRKQVVELMAIEKALKEGADAKIDTNQLLADTQCLVAALKDVSNELSKRGVNGTAALKRFLAGPLARYLDEKFYVQILQQKSIASTDKVKQLMGEIKKTSPAADEVKSASVAVEEAKSTSPAADSRIRELATICGAQWCSRINMDKANRGTLLIETLRKLRRRIPELRLQFEDNKYSFDLSFATTRLKSMETRPLPFTMATWVDMLIDVFASRAFLLAALAPFQVGGSVP